MLAKIPPLYRLGTGHVLFFYDKLAFIENRYFMLKDEVIARGFNITPKDSIVKYQQSIPEQFYGDYQPTVSAVALSAQRLIDKIHAKPNWYRLYGQVIDDQAYCDKLLTLAQSSFDG